jgi:hypothetical protein
LAVRLASPEFLSDHGLLYDVLHELSNLSLELQKRSTTLPRAEQLIKTTVRVLATFKDQPGAKLEEALEACTENLDLDPPTMPSFEGVILTKNSKVKPINRNQFLQSLIDRINARLSSTANTTSAQVISDLDILDCGKWPSEPNVRYGEKEVKRLCKQFQLREGETQQTVNGMRDFVQSGHQASPPADLKPLLKTVNTLPVSTAECERGFSLMNIICTDHRNSLLVKNIANLMFINLNGPPLSLWQPQKYVESWRKSHHRLAEDERSRRVQLKTNDETFEQLWQLL